MNAGYAGIPDGFTEAFLDWFRERTEVAWATYHARALAEYIADGVGGDDWQQGTRWTDGLNDDQIAEVERRWGLRFPPDFRLFLRRLHTVDRPMSGARFTNVRNSPDAIHSRTHLVPHQSPSFRKWLTDISEIHGALDWLTEGLEFDIEHNELWRPGWGPMPEPIEARKALARQLVAAAPRLIPVFSHRYLLAEPCQAGNPVFSIHQSDIIIYSTDLRGYFLIEFADLLGLEQYKTSRAAYAAEVSNTDRYAAIPFWGDLCT